MSPPSPHRPRAGKTASRSTARRPRLPKAIRVAVEAVLAKKGMDVMVLDLRKSDAFTDFFVIATGANLRQVHAIADAVDQALKAEGMRPSNIEGYRRAEWVLVDYFDFVVHIFSPSARTFYGLERLWATAKHISIAGDARQG